MTKREDELNQDLISLHTENAKLRQEVEILQEQLNQMKKGLRAGDVVVRAIVGEPLSEEVSFKDMLVPVESLAMPEGGVLVVATVGNAEWEPGVEEIDAVVQALTAAVDAAMPKRPYAVLGFANGVKVDAFLVKGAEVQQ